VARLGWLPELLKDGEKLLYVGAMTRAVDPKLYRQQQAIAANKVV
jgi:hypothetical protein